MERTLETVAVELLKNLPKHPLMVHDGRGGWRMHDAAASLSTEQIAAMVTVEWMRCKASPLYFITNYCVAVDLQEEIEEAKTSKMEIMPDWPHVRAVVDAMFPVRNVLIAKSRRMLVTWTAMCGVLWELMFLRNWSVLTLSRIEQLVDDGGENATFNSMHGKVRFLIDHLPPFLQGWKFEIKKLSIINTQTNSMVQGFSSSHSPGRSGGFNRAILDEFAWVEHSDAIMASVTMACPRGMMLISTPHGKNNEFFRLFQVAKQRFPVPGSREAVAMKEWTAT